MQGSSAWSCLAACFPNAGYSLGTSCVTLKPAGGIKRARSTALQEPSASLQYQHVSKDEVSKCMVETRQTILRKGVCMCMKGLDWKSLLEHVGTQGYKMQFLCEVEVQDGGAFSFLGRHLMTQNYWRPCCVHAERNIQDSFEVTQHKGQRADHSSQSLEQEESLVEGQWWGEVKGQEGILAGKRTSSPYPTHVALIGIFH
jgi:hypothetical protein